MAIARYPSVVIDCPDPASLATFYGALLGWTVDASDDWADIRPDDASNCISFQQVEDYRPPAWPDQVSPQQMHFDLMVEDLDEGETAVLALGGTKCAVQPGETFRVFLDPASHPFCLCIA
ncbi:VOC family protein [Arthrobacter flavus]|uniref:VOC family protein n=1 Tax=Arthrobacter flavus TaxID=95172 RepID=A0ABW4QBM8_9MICC